MHQQVNNPEQLDNAMKPLFDEYTKYLEQINRELNNAKMFYRDSKVVYKWINGYITSWLVFIAIVLGLVSLYYNNSVADALFYHSNNFQYLSINIENINPICLINN